LGDAKEIKPLALADPDLKALWNEIEESAFEGKRSEGTAKD